MATRRSLKSVLKATFNPDQWQGPVYTGSGIAPWNPVDLSTYLKIYRNSDAVRTVVSFRANAAANVPIKVYGKSKLGDQEIVEALDDHALAVFYDDPNPEDTEFTFFRDLNTDMDIFEMSYWKKLRANSKLVLVRMFPDAVRYTGNNPFFPDGFEELQRDGSWKPYTRDEVFWMRGYMNGISPLETLKNEIVADDAERQNRANQSAQGWRNAGVITRPKTAGKWSDKGRERFIQQMNARYSGSGNMVGKPLLLEEDMQWHNDATSGQETAYVDSRVLTIKKVCWAFHMAPEILGIEGAPYASQLEYKRQLFQIVLSPRLKDIELQMDKQIKPEFTLDRSIYSEFNIDAMLRGDPAAQVDMGRISVGGPWLTPNEWREWVLNKKPIDGGDQLFAPGSTGAQGNSVPSQQMPRDVAGPARTPRPSDAPDGAQQAALSVDIGRLVTKAVEDALSNLDIVQKADPSEPAQASEEDSLLTQFTGSWEELIRRIKSGGVEKKDVAGIYQIQALKASSKFGSELLNYRNSSYDEARTVNYWTKTANKLSDGLLKNLSSDNPVRADVLAQTIITQAKAWGELEALRQKNLTGIKVWKTVIPHSRHDSLNGEKRALDEKFSNGLMYPSQPITGHADDVWGCRCVIEFEGVKG